MNEKRELLTYESAVQLAGISRRSIARWVSMGVLKPVHAGTGRGRRTLFAKDEILSLARRRSADGRWWISQRLLNGHTPKVIRDAAIAYRMVNGGMNANQVADRMSVTRQWVHQLLKIHQKLQNLAESSQPIENGNQTSQP